MVLGVPLTLPTDTRADVAEAAHYAQTWHAALRDWDNPAGLVGLAPVLRSAPAPYPMPARAPSCPACRYGYHARDWHKAAWLHNALALAGGNLEARREISARTGLDMAALEHHFQNCMAERRPMLSHHPVQQAGLRMLRTPIGELGQAFVGAHISRLTAERPDLAPELERLRGARCLKSLVRPSPSGRAGWGWASPRERTIRYAVADLTLAERLGDPHAGQHLRTLLASEADPAREAGP